MTPDRQIHPHDLTVACAVRAPLLLEPVDAKVETLRRCEARGDLGGLVLRSWPEAVSLEAAGPESEVVEEFRRYERWADDHGVAIRPPFRIRTRTSIASTAEKRVLVTPILCLALYLGDALAGVYPHTDGEVTRTATDAIGAIAAGELPAPLSEGALAEAVAAGPDGPAAGGIEADDADAPDGGAAVRWRAGPDAALADAGCPECGGDLVNVQGIRSCESCRWTDAELGALRSPRAKLVYLSLVDGPKSVDAIKAALDLNAGAAYSILRTLTDRGLVEREPDGTYCLRRAEPDVVPNPSSD